MERIKEEVYKCSKCGLCQSVCPIYLATKNETLLARGRFIILNNFFNNKRKLSRNFIKNLDICLNCNACKNFCPSNIDSNEIYTLLKSKYNYKSGFFPFYIKYYIFKLFSLLKKQKPNINTNKSEKKITKEKILYFQGCTNRFIDSSDKNATINILEFLGYDIDKISNDCCGLPYLSDGNINAFNKHIKKIETSIPKDVKYIVCSCDSCYETLIKINTIKDKLIRLDELIKKNKYHFKEQNNIVYHKPLNRKEDCYLPDSIKEINRKGACSTMENFFLIKHPDITEAILEKCFYKKDEIDNKTIITTCLLDKFGLKNGAKNINSNANIYSYSEYIYLSDKDFQKR